MRASENDVLRHRTNLDPVFMTGGTGFLGSHLAAELLMKGYRIILLARASADATAEQRVHRLLDWLGLEERYREHLEVVDGSLDARRFGLDKELYNRLLCEVGEIIHCASNTSFSEGKRPSIERTNICGMEHMLDFAANGRVYFFHYVSTAYSAGARSGICLEEIAQPLKFTNVYEETKYRAERMAAERCRKEGIRYSIYRPSVVYGNSITGRSTRFNAVYYPVKTVLYLRSLFTRDIRECEGENAKKMGVTFTANGSIYLPIRIATATDGGVNLIPIDYFANAFTAIMDESLESGIFHIVNRNLIKIEDLMRYTQKLFKIEGMEPCRAESFNDRPRNALEILFDTYIDIYGPYMKDTRIFDDRRTQAILAPKGIVCPDFDYEIFSRCMNYGVECGWGKKIFAVK